MSLILLGVLNAQAAGGPAGSYWWSTVDSPSPDIYAIAADSANNLYIVGNETNSDFHFVASFDTDGVLLSQKKFTAGGGTSAINSFWDIKIDSSDNLYLGGHRDDAGSANFQAIAVKMATDLSITWERQLGSTGFEDYKGVAFDSSGNIYFAGRAEGSGQMLLAKYNSSGTIQFQVAQALSGGAYEGIASDGTYIYATGEASNLGDGNNTATLTQYNTSGVVQWTRKIGGPEYDYSRYGVCDSSGNVYVLIGQGQQEFKTCLLKYNSSGTLQWQRYISPQVGAIEGNKMAIDSEDNIYIAAGYGFTSSYKAYIAKYDSSGTIQWQRSFETTDFSIRIHGLTIDNNGDVCFSGYAAGSWSFAGKIPADGSLTSTFSIDGGSITYGASSLTTGTSTLSSGVQSTSAATKSYSESAESLTATTTTYTTDTAAIG